MSVQVLEKSLNFLQLWPGKCFLMIFACPRQNINHSSEKVIYIRHLSFYAIINYRFKISELKNLEKLMEETVQILKLD